MEETEELQNDAPSCDRSHAEQAKLTLLDRLEREQRRLVRQLSHTEAQLQATNSAISLLKDKPELEEAFTLIERGL